MARPDLATLLERRATAALLLVSGALSVLRLVGYDLDYLIAESPGWQRQPWQLFTTTLLHADALHLVFNLYWTAVFGAAIEGVLGMLRTAALFVLLGACSSAAELAVTRGGIGLSGIGYGLFGFLWVIQRSDARFRGALDRSTTQAFVVWFFFCIAATFTGMLPVANFAHASGAVLGGLLGWAASRARGPRLARFLAPAGFVALVALASTVGRPFLKDRELLALEYGQEGLDALVADQAERAVERLELSVRADPTLGWSWWNLGFAQSRLELLEEANESFDRAIALEPPEDDDRAHVASLKTHLADRARKAGHAQEAEELLREALALDARFAAALGRLAFLREESGDVDGALDLYEQALDAGSDEAWVRARLDALKAGRGE